MKTMIKYFVKGLLTVVVPVTFCVILIIGMSALCAFVDTLANKNDIFTDNFRNMVGCGFVWVVCLLATFGMTVIFFAEQSDKRQTRSMQRHD
jgi:fumarate reductase subunit C